MHDTTIHRIKAIRKQKNMQQQEVAERLNISQSAYAKIENGQSKVDTDRLLQLADIFEVPYDSLLPGENNSHFSNNQITNAASFVEHFYASSKEAYEQHITQLMEVIRGLRASQEKTQSANMQLLEEIRSLRQLLMEMQGRKEG
ncbi:MAG: helix-turn-helix transcriptional regulator [Saprospiraceae bacterium]